MMLCLNIVMTITINGIIENTKIEKKERTLLACRICNPSASPLASNTVTDVGEARPEVKKFMTKVNKTVTKYKCKINALTTQATYILNLHCR